MNIDRWKEGDVLELETGSVVKVLGKTPDGRALRIVYIDAPFEPEKLGTEALEDGFLITGAFQGEDNLTGTYSSDLTQPMGGGVQPAR